MNSLKKLASEIGLSLSYLLLLQKHKDKYYKTYFIKKKSGKLRYIAAPSYEIKAIQSWILRRYIEIIPISERATGFIKNKGIKTNAAFHLDNKFVMCLDISDFFPSISYVKVAEVLKKQIENEDIANYISDIATYKGFLPQGGVTSPAISNIIFEPEDAKIQSMCDNKGITYTRYADDLTFSSSYLKDLQDIKLEIGRILKGAGFKLNDDKTRIMSGKKRKLVTGILLNSGRMTVGKGRKKIIRAALFNHIVKGEEINLNETYGMISFIRDIEPDYYAKLQEYISQLIVKKTIFSTN